MKVDEDLCEKRKNTNDESMLQTPVGLLLTGVSGRRRPTGSCLPILILALQQNCR